MINVKNVYWMLAYAFRCLKQDEIKKLKSETFEDIYDLFCAMLTQGISKQLKNGLNKEYITKQEETRNLKGKILLAESIKKNTMKNARMVCEFDDYSINSYMNQILKTAAMKLIQSNKILKVSRKNELKRVMLFFKDVSTLDGKNIRWSSLKYDRNNSSYKILMNISYLILEGLIINTDDGNQQFMNFIDDQKMHRLYEKFILEYYRYHYPELCASAPQVKWDVNEDAAVELLPKMQTDIVLKYKGEKLIIDAKYYSKIMQKNEMYNKETFRSNNLYQIFTYIKNEDKDNKGNVSGLLLYAKTDENVQKSAEYNMSGNYIMISNLELDGDFEEDIKPKLNSFAEWLKNKSNNNMQRDGNVS